MKESLDKNHLRLVRGSENQHDESHRINKRLNYLAGALVGISIGALSVLLSICYPKDYVGIETNIFEKYDLNKNGVWEEKEYGLFARDYNFRQK